MRLGVDDHTAPAVLDVQVTSSEEVKRAEGFHWDKGFEQVIEHRTKQLLVQKLILKKLIKFALVYLLMGGS